MEFICKFVILAVIMVAEVYSSQKIGKSLQQNFLLAVDQAEPHSVILSFSQKIETVLSRINLLRFEDMGIRRSVQQKAQKEFSNKNQRDVQDFLRESGVDFETLWINNKMHIPSANYNIIRRLAQFPSVTSIELEEMVHLSPLNGDAIGQADDPHFSKLTHPGISWGITKIRADQVWQNYTGKGVVVANIDTGVRASHVALSSNWRSQYGWYDPVLGTATPTDEDGHGTHTMGSFVGSKGVGVAFGASWIACRSCYHNACFLSNVIKCGQWVLCPTLPDGGSSNCSMAPRIVSNSWSGQEVHWFDDIIDSWHVAGIIPVFSIGNRGPKCSTAEYAGDHPNTISVGNMDTNDKIDITSSRGPTSQNKTAPDISAPGTDIKSAGHNDDSEYVVKTGTSMSCPIVAGVIALMLEKSPALNYQKIYQAITSTAETSSINFDGAQTCGGIAPDQFPNNVFGYGKIDALNAVNAV